MSYKTELVLQMLPASLSLCVNKILKNYKCYVSVRKRNGTHKTLIGESIVYFNAAEKKKQIPGVFKSMHNPGFTIFILACGGIACSAETPPPSHINLLPGESMVQERRRNLNFPLPFSLSSIRLLRAEFPRKSEKTGSRLLFPSLLRILS